MRCDTCEKNQYCRWLHEILKKDKIMEQVYTDKKLCQVYKVKEVK